MRTLLFAVMSLVLLTGCQKKSNKGGGVRQIKGDPWVFVKSAHMNSSNAIPDNYFASGDRWTLSLRGFAEEPPEQPKENLEDGNQAPDPGLSEVDANRLASESEFIAIDNGFTFKNSYFRARFARNPKSKKIQLVSVETDRADGGGTRPYIVGQDIQVLHTSFNSEAFSILVRSESPGDRFVISLTFNRSGPIPIAKNTLENYYYLLGKGLKFPWRQDVPRVLVLCGNPGAGATQAFERGVNAWRAQLFGRLNFESRIATDCPPFSDLNSQVTVFVDEWIEVVGPQAKAAFTTTTFNFAKGEIADSDIFFLREEWQEMVGGFANLKVNDTNTRIVAAYAETLTHEMGHFLGLHHQFDKGVPSIMGYSDIDFLTFYDINAIQALYPKTTP